MKLLRSMFTVLCLTMALGSLAGAATVSSKAGAAAGDCKVKCDTAWRYQRICDDCRTNDTRCNNPPQGGGAQATCDYYNSCQPGSRCHYIMDNGTCRLYTLCSDQCPNIGRPPADHCKSACEDAADAKRDCDLCQAAANGAVKDVISGGQKSVQ